MVVHRLDQHAHAFWRGELADAVTEVEDLGRAGGGGVGVWLAKGVQHATCFGGDGIRWGKQGVGV